MAKVGRNAGYGESSKEAGDRLVLHTDGVLEATNAEEEFGAGRLHALVRETAHLTHTKALDRIISSVEAWSAEQSDDLTLVFCDYKG